MTGTQTQGVPPRNLCLDGIRGIAIAMVIVHHAFGGAVLTNRFSAILAEFSSATWIGVDLFFALSGYLITCILLKSREDPGYFRIFYMRRFFRIFPLYYSFLGVLLLATVVWPAVIGPVGLSWNMPYLANVRLALYGWPGWCITHLWSLSVEEQFYLIWPALLFVTPRRRTLATIVAVWGLLIAGRQWFEYSGVSNIAIYGLFHQDGLLVGSALAALESTKLIDRARILRIAEALLLAASAILFVQLLRGGGLYWRGWSGIEYLNYLVVAIAGAALIGTSVYSDSRSLVNRILMKRPFVAFGKYSYAIYLFHYPLDFLSRALGLHPVTVVGTIPYVFLLAAASFCLRGGVVEAAGTAVYSIEGSLVPLWKRTRDSGSTGGFELDAFVDVFQKETAINRLKLDFISQCGVLSHHPRTIQLPHVVLSEDLVLSDQQVLPERGKIPIEFELIRHIVAPGRRRQDLDNESSVSQSIFTSIKILIRAASNKHIRIGDQPALTGRKPKVCGYRFAIPPPKLPMKGGKRVGYNSAVVPRRPRHGIHSAIQILAPRLCGALDFEVLLRSQMGDSLRRHHPYDTLKQG